MLKKLSIIALSSCFLVSSCSHNPPKSMASNDDSYLWLEEVEGKPALDFVKKENEATLNILKNDPNFKGIEAKIRKISLAQDRIPWVSERNGKLYNFWRDQKNVRGLWRRTSLAEYKKNNPKWETILDLDLLAKKENENWVWKGANCLPPTHNRCLIDLSRGGKDATVVREFDVSKKKFVTNGFEILEAKSSVSWKDLNSVFVSTEEGPDTMTDSGYPRTLKILKRGEKLSQVPVIFEINKKDLSVYGYTDFSIEKNYHFINHSINFYESEIWFELSPGKNILIPMPKDASFYGVHKDYLLYQLKSELITKKKAFKQGSLLALPIKELTQKDVLEKLELIFEPTDKRFFQSLATTKNHILLEVIDNIQGKIMNVTFVAPHSWTLSEIQIGNNGMASIASTVSENDSFLASYNDFITPPSLVVGDANNSQEKVTTLKTSPKRFNELNLISEQKFAKSKDGTMIPYFIVYNKNLVKDGSNPTLLHGYGGFESSELPYYLSSIGKVWSEQGGVYVLANIRGGGEFGPAWHQAALKEKRQVVFDDFIAIAEDLIKEKITSPRHLGIKGGSNGGLLTGGTFIQRPDLFNAVLCEVPLLDMFRYHKLLAGASWMGEYGDPDDQKMREVISKYSPYQNIKKDVKYPEVFFLTSTKDDRVHPGHARKMVAKMRELGHPLFYYENTEGGHAGSANIEQSILWSSLEYTYLWKKLK